VTKKDQIKFLNKLYVDLVYFEKECGKHKDQEVLYLKNAQNSIDVCLSSKTNKNKNKGWYK
jgi:hypothetical protein